MSENALNNEKHYLKELEQQLAESVPKSRIQALIERYTKVKHSFQVIDTQEMVIQFVEDLQELLEEDKTDAG